MEEYPFGKLYTAATIDKADHGLAYDRAGKKEKAKETAKVGGKAKKTVLPKRHASDVDMAE